MRQVRRSPSIAGQARCARGYGRRLRSRLAVPLALFLSIAGPYDAVRAKEPSAPSQGATGEAASAATPEVVTAHRRWTSRLTEYPGKLARVRGSYRLELMVPGPVGVGDGVQIVVGKEDRKVSGRIAEVAPVTKVGDPVRVVIRIPDGEGLEAGMDARLQMTVRDRRVVAVPGEAIRRSGGDATVVLVDATGASESRRVETGATLLDGWVEIRSGLSAGDRVAVP